MKSHLFGSIVVAATVFLASFSAQADLSATYTDPSQAKQLIQQAMQSPQSQNDTKVFYSCCISQFDDFIPCNPDLHETSNGGQLNNKYTYRDGRISTVETIDASGNTTECYAVWNNDAGAPVLSAYRNRNGDYDWYIYAEYDSSGKIQKLYRFGNSFVLGCYDEFSYQDNVTSIQEYSRDSRPLLEKRVTNNVDRKQGICALEKFGLKPIYPNY